MAFQALDFEIINQNFGHGNTSIIAISTTSHITNFTVSFTADSTVASLPALPSVVFRIF
jgi:hypothetical protein